MNKEYLLSIVVPTKDRYYYLKHLIMLIHGFKSEDIELVIQDNTKNNEEIKSFIANLNYPDLYYYHTDEPLSVSDNSTKAILNSHGEYVCFIGDDDGVFPEILECVKDAKLRGIESIVSKVIRFNWPDYIDNSRYKISGVVLEEITSRKEGFIDVKSELNKVIKGGFSSLGLLPKVYQGIVSRKLLNRVFDKCGTYFPGPSPDMANAIALAVIADKVYYYDRRLIITGQCKSVGGGERLLQGVLKPITEIPHFSQCDIDSWCSYIPTVWCEETVWPTSGIQALATMGCKYRIPYTKIYARFLYKHSSYSSLIEQFRYGRFSLNMYILSFKVSKFIEGIRCRLSYALTKNNVINKNTVYRGFSTINDVIKI